MLRWTRQEIRELIAKGLTLSEFDKILAERGTDVIGPGAITTMELRGDQSRFFARLDDDCEKVIGGDFG